MKTYCLTLRETPWRRAPAEERFRAAGLEVEWFEGLHGPTLGLVPRLGTFEDRNYRMPAGRVGLWLSFLMLWRVALERGHDPILILEDDAVPQHGFSEHLDAALADLPADWDVLHVGTTCVEDKPTERLTSRISRIRYPFGNHAVLWRRQSLARAVEILSRSPCNTHLDITLTHLVYPRLNGFACDPPLVTQASSHKEDSSTVSAYWDSIQGWFDYARIYDEALDRAGRRPARFVEIGSWLGRSAAYMGEEIKRRHAPVEFWAVDTWRGSPGHAKMASVVADAGGDLLPTFCRNMSRAGVCDYVRPLQLPSLEAVKTFADGNLDFVFVDGDHSYDAVCADIRAWRPKLKPGGVMAGHDHDRADVQRAVRDTLGTRYRTWERCWIAT